MQIIFLNLFIILILSISLSLLVNVDLYKTIPTVTLSIPLIHMYVAFFTNLDIAIGVIYTLALVLFVLALLKCNKSAVSIKKFILDNRSVILIYLIIAMYFIFVNYNRPAWEWDDFSHWARVVKNMNWTRHLNRASDAYLGFLYYPPNVSLFLYFFDWGVFTEWQLFYAQSLYIWTLVFPIVFYLGNNKSNVYKILLTILVLSIPSSINITAYITLFVDTIMGLLLGYAMVEYMFEENIKLRFINISLSLMALTLTKDAGVILSILFVLIIFVNEVIKYFKNSKNYELKKNIVLNFRYLFFNILLVVIVYISYKMYLNYVGIQNVDYAKDYTSGGLFQLNSWSGITIKNFYHKIFDYSFGNLFNLTTVNIILVILFLAMILLKLNNEKQTNFVNVILLTLFGFIIYLLLLLYTYICRFDEYEGVNLASYDRYISTYLLFLFVTVIIAFVHSFPKKINIIIAFIIFSLMFSPIKGLFQITLGVIYNKNNKIQESEYYNSKADYIKNYIDVNDAVTIISIGNSGYNYMRITYSMGPEYKLYYLGEPSTTKESMYSNVLLPKEFMKKLSDNSVRYVYLDNINDKFMNDYLELFESIDDIKNGNIFIINRNEKFERIGD